MRKHVPPLPHGARDIDGGDSEVASFQLGFLILPPRIQGAG